VGAKLTGAGGGGCVVALVDSAARGAEVLAAWKSEGFDGFAAVVKADVENVLELLAKHRAGVATAESP
jgi:mevalonate kinase